MTVSPGWPQDGNSRDGNSRDGNSPSQDIEDVVESEAATRKVLPPTLFQLPNLRTGMVPAATAPESVSEEAKLVEKEPTPTAPEVSLVEEPDSNVHDVNSLDSVTIEPPLQPAPSPESPSDIPTAIESQSLRTSPADDPITNPIPPSRPPADAPAGRSWAESIGSHGVVIVLLLVVVAAALITGREGQDEDVQSSLAQHSDLLEFDKGVDVAIPEPKQTSRIEDALAAVETEEESSASDVNVPPVAASVAGADSTSVVTLDPPTAQSDADALMESSPSTVRTNEFAASSTDLEVQPASTRVDAYSVPAMSDVGVTSPLATTEHRLSSTPVDMQNLLQYLPPKPQSGTWASETIADKETLPSYAH